MAERAGSKPASRPVPRATRTPATKEATGHDENISFERTVEIVGRQHAEALRDRTLAIYQKAADYAATKGILIADTKFEFGLDDAGTLTLADEALTPDSSRFWPARNYTPGRAQPSYDKQFVRDWLESIGWNKQPPVPALPDSVVTIRPTTSACPPAPATSSAASCPSASFRSAITT